MTEIQIVNGETAGINYIPRVVSPMGAITDYEQMAALIFEGRKYWLSPSEYSLLGSPPINEISLSEFKSYPDGFKPITINGVLIHNRATHMYEPSKLDVIVSKPKYIIITVIILLGSLIIFKVRSKRK